MQLDKMEIRANFQRAWRSASNSQKERGLRWYYTAHDLATMIGKGDTSKGAGYLAALSPLLDWRKNVELAFEASRGNFYGALPLSLNKAERIYKGESPVDVLPMDAKTGQFYLCILNPEDKDAVVIDTWMIRQALGIDGKIPSITKHNYWEIGRVIRQESRYVGVLSMQFQAVCWNVAREG